MPPPRKWMTRRKPRLTSKKIQGLQYSIDFEISIESLHRYNPWDVSRHEAVVRYFFVNWQMQLLYQECGIIARPSQMITSGRPGNEWHGSNTVAHQLYLG